MRGLRLSAVSTATATVLALGLASGCSDTGDVPIAKQGPPVTAEPPPGPPPKSSDAKQGSKPPAGGGSPAGKSPQDYSK